MMEVESRTRACSAAKQRGPYIFIAALLLLMLAAALCAIGTHACDPEDENPCNGQGTCDEETAVCTCNTEPVDGGWLPAGLECDLQACPLDTGDVCNGHGCRDVDDNCECNVPFGGDACGTLFCGTIAEDDATVCSGHGTCAPVLDHSDNTTVTGSSCHCANGYTGTNCEDAICYGKAASQATACSGPLQGVCTAPDLCSCESGYYGSNCSHPILPGTSIQEAMRGIGVGQVVDIPSARTVAHVYGFSVSDLDGSYYFAPEGDASPTWTNPSSLGTYLRRRGAVARAVEQSIPVVVVVVGTVARRVQETSSPSGAQLAPGANTLSLDIYVRIDGVRNSTLVLVEVSGLADPFVITMTVSGTGSASMRQLEQSLQKAGAMQPNCAYKKQGQWSVDGMNTTKVTVGPAMRYVVTSGARGVEVPLVR